MSSAGMAMAGTTATLLDPSCSKLSFTTNPSNKLSFTANPSTSPAAFHLRTTTPAHRSSRPSSRIKAMAAGAGNLQYMNRDTFYDLLGISVTGTLSEIKQAYKQLAKKYHPDVSPPGRVEEYTKRFIQVQEAYETLSDPKSRALYDRDMAKCLDMAFSTRQQYYREELEWQWRWQSQLSELNRRSMDKDSYNNSGENMSWGARMRRQRGNKQTSTVQL